MRNFAPDGGRGRSRPDAVEGMLWHFLALSAKGVEVIPAGRAACQETRRLAARCIMRNPDKDPLTMPPPGGGAGH